MFFPFRLFGKIQGERYKTGMKIVPRSIKEQQSWVAQAKISFMKHSFKSRHLKPGYCVVTFLSAKVAFYGYQLRRLD